MWGRSSSRICHESAGTIFLDAFASAGLSSLSGLADGFITTKTATSQLKKAIGTVPKMLKGNHPAVKALAKKEVKSVLSRAGKSIISTAGWSTSISTAVTKVKKVIRNTV